MNRVNRGERIHDVNDERQPRRAGDDEHPDLMPCPCGEDTVWYRVVMVADLTPGRGKAVSAMVANDFYEDLCDECFKAAFGADDMDGWVQIR